MSWHALGQLIKIRKTWAYQAHHYQGSSKGEKSWSKDSRRVKRYFKCFKSQRKAWWGKKEIFIFPVKSDSMMGVWEMQENEALKTRAASPASSSCFGTDSDCHPPRVKPPFPTLWGQFYTFLHGFTHMPEVRTKGGFPAHWFPACGHMWEHLSKHVGGEPRYASVAARRGDWPCAAQTLLNAKHPAWAVIWNGTGRHRVWFPGAWWVSMEGNQCH